MVKIRTSLIGRSIAYALLAFHFSLFTFHSFSQNVGVSINTTGAAANSSALLDVSSTTQGALLIPRMSTADRNAISSPIPESLLIYNTDTHCFEAYYNGGWVAFGCLGCQLPSQPGSITGTGTVCQGQSGVTYSISQVTGATSYTWSVPSGASITSGQGTTIVTVTFGSASGNVSVTASNACGTSSAGTLGVTTVAALPSAPTADTNTVSQTSIVWNWSDASSPVSYEWGTTTSYGSATGNGRRSSYTQTGLTCNTPYTLYVWAYNACGNSTYTTLTQTTSPWTCGSPLTVAYTQGVNGAPETKTINYLTGTTSITGTSQCWILQNLGATVQAIAASDTRDTAAGWYFQFNYSQGYANTSVYPSWSVYPAWTITSSSYNGNWLSANDPCTIELGTGWRIPTYTEWYNANANGGGSGDAWQGICVGCSYPDYAAPLYLHAAGYLLDSDGSLSNRGSYAYGSYWSSTPYSASAGWGWFLVFYNGGSSMNCATMADGFSIRCLRD